MMQQEITKHLIKRDISYVSQKINKRGTQTKEESKEQDLTGHLQGNYLISLRDEFL